MKICWDNLENLTYNSKKNIWYKKYTKYVYMESCKECGDSYLTIFNNISDFCSLSCSTTGKNNPMYGRKHTEKSKIKNIESNKKVNRKKGKESSYWKGGYNYNIPLYDTYASQIDWCEKVRRNKEDKNIFEVKCTYCGKWYVPKRHNIIDRIKSLNGKVNGELRLYCSFSCKQECPIYHKILFSAEESNTKELSREVQPELRQLVFERDKYKCMKCGSVKSLHCHHIEGIRWEPLESADIDKCITYCKKCHKEAHKKEDCGYQDMQCITKEELWRGTLST